MNFINLESNFGQSKGGPKNKTFLDYVGEGDSQLYGDYNTSRPPKKTKRDEQKIRRNDSRGFGFDLQNLGDQFAMSEIGIGNSIRIGNQGRKKRLENYREEKAEKLKARGLQEGKTIGRTVYDRIKLAHNKRKTTNVLKKYYKPESKSEQEERQTRLPEEPTLKQARNGYKGYVSRPTFFLAGEAGREFVSIKPMKRKTSRKQNNGPYDLMAGYNGIMNFRT